MTNCDKTCNEDSDCPDCPARVRDRERAERLAREANERLCRNPSQWSPEAINVGNGTTLWGVSRRHSDGTTQLEWGHSYCKFYPSREQAEIRANILNGGAMAEVIDALARLLGEYEDILGFEAAHKSSNVRRGREALAQVPR